MIGRCWFNTFTIGATTGADVVLDTITPDLDYGLLMVEYDAPPPEPRIYRATIEGRDGTLDLSEWEGYKQVRYNDRTVTIKLRDMNGQQEANSFIRRILGKRCYIHFDDDTDYYFRGRCEMAETQTRRHVTDINLSFTCHPFRYSVGTKKTSWTIDHGTKTETLPGHYSVIPTIETFTVTMEENSIVPVFTASNCQTTMLNDYKNRIVIYNSGVWGEGFYTEHLFDENGVIDTSGAVLKRGNNLIRIWNYCETNNITVTMTWRPEVI